MPTPQRHLNHQHHELDDQAEQSTQSVADIRRIPGKAHQSGLAGSDPWNVICILHPSSPAAFDDVAHLADYAPQHLLRQPSIEELEYGGDVDLTLEAVGGPTKPPTEQTKPLSSANMSRDIALRFDSNVKSPHMGFIFGRNPEKVDIQVGDNVQKRVSNTHFRIYVNKSGMLMIQDMSTNGTVVGDVYLQKGKKNEKRMLLDGTLIRFVFDPPEQELRFNVRIPSRDGHEEQYHRALDDYLQRIEIFEGQELALQRAAAVPVDAAIHPAILRNLMPNPNDTPKNGSPFKTPAQPVATRHPQQAAPPRRSVRARVQTSQWKGGEKYNVIETAGKGAFSTVYKVATKDEGEVFAAKELNKRNILKDELLDATLDKEIRILERIDHVCVKSFTTCPERQLTDNSASAQHRQVHRVHQRAGFSEYLHHHGIYSMRRSEQIPSRKQKDGRANGSRGCQADSTWIDVSSSDADHPSRYQA
jgi:hypothetical protein